MKDVKKAISSIILSSISRSSPRFSKRLRSEFAASSQHSMFLTDRGILYTQGRSADGQLGNNSRKESKLPTAVSALKDDFICHIAAGADYSVAVAESGTVFAWGSNACGQLGKYVTAHLTNEPGATSDNYYIDARNQIYI